MEDQKDLKRRPEKVCFSYLMIYSNQSMKNTSLNQSRLAPPQLPRPARTNTALSTIAPAAPSVAPQSLNFDLASPVRPLGLLPMSASIMALNTVQQYALSSMRAAAWQY